ncbi:glutamate-5-semialdehyde dehydrogenase [Candidatus Nanopelagicus hibericus]|uniref:Gamma-glutamyl phosphate reductase n=1 Tax=Candidatus Nanopelagicus hibericus TaxID=1884915 RepID=A0A249K9V7_9ACTN|nr:glutamate-5-semialdehyde dehydrogenase [Candidatus Nanopelagicus hibericus]ASY13567.1 glutamate-5-semialdehyde dehydrogenase [Candidatus Nanopelagicus hibericus]
MDATTVIAEIANKANSAARTLASSSAKERNQVLLNIADQLEINLDLILKANQIDMQAAQSAGINSSLQDRLLLTPNRVKAMAQAARDISKLPDPLGRIIVERNLANGLNLKQISVPFGVVGMVYEARPNVTVDAAVILIKSGNAALLRGSSTAVNSNQVLIDVMKKSFNSTPISSEVLQLIPATDRSTVTALLTARGKIDLVIPRGSSELIRSVVDEATVPTIETGAGVCHVYVDKSADFKKAIAILINSKCDRPSVCNAAETLLIHQDIANEFTPIVFKELKTAGVIINTDEQSKKIADKTGIKVNLATQESWSTEYGTLEINVAQVSDVMGAIDHIARYGTKHTEAIVASDQDAISKFTSLNDCAAIMVNASTRFTDGGQMGFGAEIGISNQKMHARGPMGLEQMTTTTWIVSGSGQIRE